ncbi:MAG TPA: TolC family protein [Puia sp.]|nr:TolC family protein [Puia sp.]
MQKIKTVLLFWISFLIVNVIFCQDENIGSAINLKQCIDIAIKNNLQVEQSDLNKQTAGVYFKQSKDNILPNISASASQTESFGRSLNYYTYSYVNQQINYGNYGIGANLILFSGLQYQNAMKRDGLAYEASKLDYQQQKETISVNVILAYLQVLSTKELVDISKTQADVDKQQISRLELLNQSGALKLLSDLSDLKGQYANDLVNIASLQNTLELAKVNLFSILNIPYKRDIVCEPLSFNLDAVNEPSNPDSIYQSALKTIPAVRSADLKIREYEKALQVARGQYYPTLSLGAGINTSYSNAATASTPLNSFNNDTTTSYVTVNNSNYKLIVPQQNFQTQKISFGDQFKNNRSTYVGLNLSLPILNNFRARNNVKLAKINLQNAKNNATNTKLDLQQKVEQAYQNIVLARLQYKSYIDAVAAYKESFRTTEIRFNEGVIASDVYLIAKGNIDRANINLSISKYNYIFRSKILDYYEGVLSWQ